MAKILAKLFSASERRAIKLQQKYNWIKTEHDAVPSYYDQKKDKRLKAFNKKANRKLLKPAFDACDKLEYAQCQFDEALLKYDVKAYLSYRAAHHKAAKAIFKAVRAGKDWQIELDKMQEKTNELRQKRNSYIHKLEKQRSEFVARYSMQDQALFEAQKLQLLMQLQTQRNQLVEQLDARYEALVAQKQASMQKKMDRLNRKMSASRSHHQNEGEMADDVILSVKGLKMYFGGLKAVDDLTFDVKKGEIFGLIGPNGAGKTTVFNCITKFYKTTDGQLLFRTGAGEIIRLTDYQVHDIVLKGIARTFQNLEVVKEVSVLDNLLIAATRQYTSGLITQMFHLPLLGREERVIRARADKILKYMGLASYRDRLAWGLPYGVLKRLEIARALMCNPKLIILDEPAAGLNESETRDLAALINQIRVDFDCTILLVEHDMSLVMNVCDHICAISFGKKLAYGTAEQIQSSKEVQEAYLGTGGA